MVSNTRAIHINYSGKRKGSKHPSDTANNAGQNDGANDTTEGHQTALYFELQQAGMGLRKVNKMVSGTPSCPKHPVEVLKNLYGHRGDLNNKIVVKIYATKGVGRYDRGYVLREKVPRNFLLPKFRVFLCAGDAGSYNLSFA